MTWGPKYKIIYKGNVAVATQEIKKVTIIPGDKIIAKILKNGVNTHYTKASIPSSIPSSQPRGRGYAIAVELIKNGITDKVEIYNAIYNFYKTNTNRGEYKITKDTKNIIEILIKEKII